MNNKTKTIQEILEVWDWDTGLPTGNYATRDEVHQSGIPHEAVHLWILRYTGPQPELLFQQRAPHKENYPDCLDITVGGHVPYGFAGNKVFKESQEEIGLGPVGKGLVDIGWYRYEEQSPPLFQREFQHVYILRDDRSLDRYCFRDGEVTGIYAVRIDDVRTIVAGDTRFEIHGYDGRETVRRTVTRKDFHPQLFHPSMDVYMRIVLQAAVELAAAGHAKTRLPDI